MANTKITSRVIADNAVTTAAIADGAITSAKLDTNIAVAGTLTVTGDITGTLATAAQPNITSIGTLTGLTTTGNINFGDNDKAIFGAGSDLQIYHDGSNSYIDDAGAGWLVIRGATGGVSIEKYTGEVMAQFAADGYAQLRYDNSTKLTTTATGIDVTGTATMDGLTVDGGATSPTHVLTGSRAGTLVSIDNQSASTSYGLRLNIASVSANSYPLWVESNDTNRLIVKGNGDIAFYEDTGTTQKLYWDASAESLGIGTSSPSYPLEIVGSHTIYGAQLSTSSTATTSYNVMRWTQGAGSGAPTGMIGTGGSATGNSGFAGAFGIGTQSSAPVTFLTNDTERMRLTSAGQLAVGNTGYGTGVLAYDRDLGAPNMGMNITENTTFNDASGHTFTSKQNTHFVLYISVSGVGFASIPAYPNGGGGVGYNWNVLDPDNGTWSYGAPTISFTLSGSPSNAFSVAFANGSGQITVTRTSGSSLYRVVFMEFYQQ